MDVCVLIVESPDGLYQAGVLATDAARGWIKSYISKFECIAELRCLDLLGADDADLALVSDFDTLDRFLIVRSYVEPADLFCLGFAELPPEVVH